MPAEVIAPSENQPIPATRAVAPAAPAVPVGPTPEQIKADLAKLEASRRDIEKKERQHVMERRKFSAEREETKKTWGEKLSQIERIDKMKAQAKLNPEAFFKEVLGDGWYDTVVSAKINGGVPTADVLASEIAKAEERMEAKFAAEKAERAKAEKERATHQETQARRQLGAEAAEFWKAHEKEYPAFRGSPEQIAAMLARRIESEYYATEKRDPSGELLMSGRVLTMKECADIVEAEIIAHAEIVAGAEKYREKLQAKLSPKSPVAGIGGPILQRTENQQRRTLSNDLTGSTPGRQPAVTQEEKRQRAIARFNELHNKAAS